MSVEEWRSIPGHPGYQVSDQGRIWSERSQRCLAGVDVHGYRYVDLTRKTRMAVHRAVMLAFVGPLPQGQETRHLNGFSSDNRLTNLAYGTSRDNSADSVRYGGSHNVWKTHCPKGHPYEGENLRINRAGRHCRTCLREYRAEGRRTGGKDQYPHGLTKYSIESCRCDVCSAAARLTACVNRIARLQYARDFGIPPEVAHGRSAYSNWGCRCDVCREDKAAEHREYVRRKAAV